MLEPAASLTGCLSIACLACNEVVTSASAFAITRPPRTPQAFLCRTCGARHALVPYRRLRINRCHQREGFPLWAVTTLWPGFAPERSTLTVARFILEAARRASNPRT